MNKGSRSVTVVIPARYGSSRFPGKPLIELNGKPMVQHVYEQAGACRAVSEVLVATDDERIKQAVERFGGRVIMVTGDYRTGTDRVAAVARMFAGDYFLNLQGDEIPLNPELLTDLIEPFLESGVGMGTLKRVMDPTEDLLNSAVVKVVTDARGDALYFSRAPIPFVRDAPGRQVIGGLHYVHLGLYMYTKDTLLRLAALPTSRLEDAEKLEQLRALDQGIRIRVWETTHASLRVDRPEDVPDVADRLRQYEVVRRELRNSGVFFKS
ncbi:3-deoxy-manno-octulosonate cytidylyltransferase [Candidatus Nitrospira nitrificans]|uniref:3-deoxy-manno-octulosonate cytidylyltransferase n=1 Tax=Candidatus Nitrospira nitrificans TaxID=1742973 RepID=A0A0S4L971_9BACT|nr:3-deoxy-manno-octulosonate cytidylyltransferase [Candidatus Nitrospira nitrificans]CUS33374.1 3-deoxy-manno-octulosonate cytidylyltransferase [Candidatus Nitrospira nitrificans]